MDIIRTTTKDKLILTDVISIDEWLENAFNTVAKGDLVKLQELYDHKAERVAKNLGYSLENLVDVELLNELTPATNSAVGELPNHLSLYSAKRAVSLFISRLVEDITGTIPTEEKLSWTVKENAAKAIVNGVNTDEEYALISGEAELTGETVLDLANKIVAKASLYRSVVAKVAGLRRSTYTELENSPVEAYKAILEAAKVKALNLKSSMGL